MSGDRPAGRSSMCVYRMQHQLGERVEDPPPLSSKLATPSPWLLGGLQVSVLERSTTRSTAENIARLIASTCVRCSVRRPSWPRPRAEARAAVRVALQQHHGSQSQVRRQRRRAVVSGELHQDAEGRRQFKKQQGHEGRQARRGHPHLLQRDQAAGKPLASRQDLDALGALLDRLRRGGRAVAGRPASSTQGATWLPTWIDSSEHGAGNAHTASLQTIVRPTIFYEIQRSGTMGIIISRRPLHVWQAGRVLRRRDRHDDDHADSRPPCAHRWTEIESTDLRGKPSATLCASCIPVLRPS